MKRLLILLALIIIPVMAISKTVDERKTQVFPSQTSIQPWKTVIKGYIVSFSALDEFSKKDLLGRAREKSKATIRLYSSKGLRPGDVLYVIDNYNLVVARVKIRVLFNSSSFGPMAVGYGNFRQAGELYRVVQKIHEHNAKDAYIYRGRGDYYRSVGDKGKAIEAYKKAIEFDSGNPQAHLALGELYLEEKVYRFAWHEFTQAYNNINRLYDREDRFVLLSRLTSIVYQEVFHNQYLGTKMKEKLIRKGLTYSQEALALKKDAPQVHLHRAFLLYRGPAVDHPRSRMHFMKVLEYQPGNTRALVALSHLYFLHRNNKKARMFVDRALEIDPTNDEALAMKKKIEVYGTP